MSPFHVKDQLLHVESVSLPEIVARVGTPAYVYSTRQIIENYRRFDRAFQDLPHLVCFAVKANSNLSILHLLAREGAGADIVSGGELYRAIRAGMPPEKIVYSGVGKTEKEIREALQAGVSRLHIESTQEFELIQQIAAQLQVPVRLAPRINPDIDPQTHPYISTGLKQNKFGLSPEEAKMLFRRAKTLPHIHMSDISVHIGSQVTQTSPFLDTVKFLAAFIEEQRQAGFEIDSIDLGGGLGVRYHEETPPTPEEYAQMLLPVLKPLNCRVILEPGRAIVGDAGLLVTRVLYTKQNADKYFTVVDAAMTDCLRPALYHAYHEILPVRSRPLGADKDAPMVTTDIVGPVCESSDFLARDRRMPLARQGDLLAVCTAGAYGFVMASRYNSRPMAPEVFVRGTDVFVSRKRETYEDLVRGEELIAF